MAKIVPEPLGDVCFLHRSALIADPDAALEHAMLFDLAAATRGRRTYRIGQRSRITSGEPLKKRHCSCASPKASRNAYVVQTHANLR